MKFAADKYYLYEEMKELLEGWAKQYPDVLRLFSIGQSWCGREIPAAALTLGGIEEEKPGVLFDGGIHSREFVGSSVVLYALFYFLDNYEKDEELHKILEEKTLYFIPRINVDGMEEDLLGKGNYRGSLKPFHEKEDGVYTTDIDGDGIIIKMRIPNENGEWRCSEEDPRLLVRRMPGDTKGPFYDVFDEGLVRGEVTTPLKASKLECDRDPNREFPFDWDRKTIGENYRYSAGNYPLEDAETRALADFIVTHNNIHTIVDEHSYMSGYISPMEFYKEKPSQPEDSMLMYEIGEAASEETGMMHANIFPLGLHGVAHGSFTPWAYFEWGIAAWCCENWNIRYLYDTVDKEHPIKKMEPLMSPEEIFQTRLALSLNAKGSIIDEKLDLLTAALPSMAAVYWYQNLQGTCELCTFVEKAWRFAGEELQPALFLGDACSEEQVKAIAGRLEHFTGMKASYFEQTGLKLRKIEDFMVQVAAGKGLRVDLYDGRKTQSLSSSYNVVGNGNVPIRIMNGSLAKKLGVNGNRLYYTGNINVNDTWSMKTSDSMSPMECLTSAMERMPDMQVLAASGLYDLCTLVGNTRYLFSHSGVKGKRLVNREYAGGHGVYSTKEGKAEFLLDVRTMIENE